MEKSLSQEFGEFLREKRKTLRLTLVQLCEQSGVSQPYLSQLENGKIQLPSPAILQKLAGPLDIDIEFLMIRAGYFTERKKKYVAYIPDNIPPDAHINLPVVRDNFLENSNDLKSSISFFMVTNNLYYNGHHLSKDEGWRVLTMLETLFPEYARTRVNKE